MKILTRLGRRRRDRRVRGIERGVAMIGLNEMERF